MLTINSISGGKSSCFMALEFKADYNVFALVEQDAYAHKPEARVDNPEIIVAHNWVRKQVSGFWCSAEDDKTLVCLQKLYNELENTDWYYNECKSVYPITIVSSSQYGKYDTYDDLIEKTKYLPNARTRLCTEKLKVEPIYNWTKQQTKEVVEMRIGFRLDEIERTVNLYFKQTILKNRVPNPDFDLQSIINAYQIPSYIVKWWDRLDVELRVREGKLLPKESPFNITNKDFWRVPSFPLIEAGITNAEIVKYWSKRPEYKFPEISNCVGCFHHSVRQLQKQWQSSENWGKMKWFSDKEKERSRLFVKGTSYEKIAKLPIQQAIDFVGWSSCDSGGCTD